MSFAKNLNELEPDYYLNEFDLEYEDEYEDEEQEQEQELTEEELELLELEKIRAEKLNHAILNMINKRFGGNIAGKNAIRTMRKKTNGEIVEKPVLDENNFNITKNGIKVAGFRKQREFGARKRIKP